MPTASTTATKDWLSSSATAPPRSAIVERERRGGKIGGGVVSSIKTTTRSPIQSSRHHSFIVESSSKENNSSDITGLSSPGSRIRSVGVTSLQKRIVPTQSNSNEIQKTREIALSSTHIDHHCDRSNNNNSAYKMKPNFSFNTQHDNISDKHNDDSIRSRKQQQQQSKQKQYHILSDNNSHPSNNDLLGPSFTTPLPYSSSMWKNRGSSVNERHSQSHSTMPAALTIPGPQSFTATPSFAALSSVNSYDDDGDCTSSTGSSNLRQSLHTAYSTADTSVQPVASTGSISSSSVTYSRDHSSHNHTSSTKVAAEHNVDQRSLLRHNLSSPLTPMSSSLAQSYSVSTSTSYFPSPFNSNTSKQYETIATTPISTGRTCDSISFDGTPHKLGGIGSIASPRRTTKTRGFDGVDDSSSVMTMMSKPNDLVTISNGSVCSSSIASSCSTTTSSSGMKKDVPLIIGKKNDFARFVRCVVGNLPLTIAIIAWFTIGVISIVTTKILVNTWQVPPLVLTTQQLFLGSIVLRTVLNIRDRNDGGIQPWPWQQTTKNSTQTNISNNNGSTDYVLHIDNSTNNLMLPSSSSSHGTSTITQLLLIVKRYIRIYQANHHFILAGVFFSMDFLFSNSAMKMSDASFVETVKASDPICTTTIALLYNVDKLGIKEGGGLSLLVIGVLLSTLGNSKNQATSVTVPITAAAADAAGALSSSAHPEHLLSTATTVVRRLTSSASSMQGSIPLSATTEVTNTIGFDGLQGSIITALAVTTANLCFAFRAMHQKKYRLTTMEIYQLDDVNLLCRMFQIGASFWLIPSLVLYSPHVIQQYSLSLWDTRIQFLALATINSLSYATYNLASTYVLSKLTMLHHSSLNCLRRMAAILATTIFFQVPMSFETILGLITCFIGFGSFTYYRNVRIQKSAEAAIGCSTSSSCSGSGTTSSGLLSSSSMPPTTLSYDSSANACNNSSLELGLLTVKDSNV